MTTYVLVPGGWHGAWSWERLAPLVAAAGAQVHTPALTGLGERAEEAGPDVGLTTHIDDVLRVLYEQDLREVILVGHSYGGMVITGAADRAPERVAQLVYLDALVPREGRSVADVLPPLDRVLRRLVRRHGEGWLVPAPVFMDRLPGIRGLFGVTDDFDRQWLRERLTPQPIRTFVEPFRSQRPGSVTALPRTYIHCTGGGWMFQLSRRFRPAYWPPKEPGWNHLHLATGHDAMITRPQELADLLLALRPSPTV